eukprot:CAMPEP_0185317408 /NCGR_PEP_ID=MMETSP1363-20130426/46754_1 /TAXON_ID=38817 /ORGANISM="Gephyrocapsa oceanica, Strain RCC1303" /LENGTH=248 /DNA_ID=CAMNT_0027915661 /DNA_START=5 /DNA_END=751 /DNA_ORIENTATION=+
MTQQVTEAFDWGFQRDSKAQLAYEAPKKVLPTLGQHGDNVRVGGGVIATRTGGSDASAVVVGSTGIQLMHPAQRGQGTFTWTIRKSQSNDGLGLYVGVADADADFLSDSWGKAWAMGCHGCNLFAWNDARGNGALVPGGLPGSEDSLEDGTTITVKVDLSASPRTLSFSINGGEFVTASDCELPPTVRPFAKLAGAEGDSVSLAYDDAPSRSSSIDETASEAAASLRTSEVWTKTERVSPGDVMSFLA